MSNAFAAIPHSPKADYRIHFYAAVYLLLHTVRRLSADRHQDLGRIVARYPFLGAYVQEMLPYLPDEVSWDAMHGWWEREISAWEGASPVGLPLVSLCRLGRLSFQQRMLLILAGLPEEDFRFGGLFASLQEPLDYRRPCLELLAVILKEGASPNWDPATAVQSLIDQGLLGLANPDAARAEWLPRPPPLVWDALRGEVPSGGAAGSRVQAIETLPRLTRLVLEDGFLDRLMQVPALVRRGRARLILVRGMSGSDRLPVLGALARALRMGLITLDPATARAETNGSAELGWQHLGPLCTLARLMPVLSFDLDPGETGDLPALSLYEGPVGVILGPEGGIEDKGQLPVLSLTLPLFRAPQRARSWAAALKGRAGDDLPEIVDRFHLSGDVTIRRVAAAAIARAALERRNEVCAQDVREACRTLDREALDRLAVALPTGGNWSQLVVSPAVWETLQELVLRCRHRERLLDHLGPGFGSQRNRGVRALFTGPSGTGKTLAARILAEELGMDLYRLDLGAVVNKYIGETEKNLHRVLAAAEELDVLLLIDEGDALLGQRTEVRSANDRYANLETNYLLQRLEQYQGIAVITTNAAQSIDRAFQRRMDVSVGFSFPEADERLSIWRLHLPGDHAVAESDLWDLAQRCPLTGGQIRNAAQYATLLALSAGGPVQYIHLKTAIGGEFRKAGALSPLEAGTEASRPAMDIRSFLEVLGP
jgi:hypothetical protein